MDLHVSNIPFKVKQEELEALFSTFGEVLAVKLIKDHKTRQNKGYGFVTMADPDAAKQALEQLHGTLFEGRELVVCPAESKSQVQEQEKTPGYAWWKAEKKAPPRIVRFDNDEPKRPPRKKR